MIDKLRSSGIGSFNMCEMFLIEVCGLHILLQNNTELLLNFSSSQLTRVQTKQSNGLILVCKNFLTSNIF